MKKQTFYFVLIPAKQAQSYGGVLIMDREHLAKELAEDIGGAYVPSTFSLN